MYWGIAMLKRKIKDIIVLTDHRFDSDLLDKARDFIAMWRSSNMLNAIRRKIYPAIVKLRYAIDSQDARPFRLHLGCGKDRFDGYINIDWRKTVATDLVCDIRKLPYPDAHVDLIETHHVIEHFPKHEFPKALKEWFRVMAPGGKLIIECPNFDLSVKEYIDGNENRIDNIFGNQLYPGDTHFFGYNFKRLKRMLTEAGFRDVRNEEPTDYHIEIEPCLRVTCLKVK